MLRVTIALVGTLALLPILVGCAATPVASTTPSVGTSTPIDGSKTATQQAWADEEVRAAEIEAQKRKKIAQLQQDTDDDIAAMALLSAARQTANAKADSELRQARLGVAGDELGGAVRHVSDSERLYWEEKARRDGFELPGK